MSQEMIMKHCDILLVMTQEMMTKILKVLNDDEDVCGNVTAANAASDDEFVSAME